MSEHNADYEGLRILLVDDDQDLRESVANALRSMGHEVFDTDNGDIAGNWASGVSRPFDVIVSDFDLGLRDRRSGVEICEVLRPIQPDAHFIVYSGLDRDVPDWIEFVSKINFRVFFDAVTRPAHNGSNE